MRLDLRLAKSIMEHEEGMNHLWIQFFYKDFSTRGKAEIRIDLPDGLFRSPNLNGYDESKTNTIILDLSQDKDVLIELYTQSPVDYCEASIIVALCYNDNQNNRKELIRELPIRFVSEDKMEELDIDDQVIERLKELANPIASSQKSDEDLVYIPPRTYEIRGNEYDYLEKKYRVEY